MLNSSSDELQNNWRRSSFCSTGACLEVNLNLGSVEAAAVGVRDSKDEHGPVLAFAPEVWQTFVNDVVSGQVQRPQA